MTSTFNFVVPTCNRRYEHFAAGRPVKRYFRARRATLYARVIDLTRVRPTRPFKRRGEMKNNSYSISSNRLPEPDEPLCIPYTTSHPISLSFSIPSHTYKRKLKNSLFAIRRRKHNTTHVIYPIPQYRSYAIKSAHNERIAAGYEWSYTKSSLLRDAKSHESKILRRSIARYRYNCSEIE